MAQPSHSAEPVDTGPETDPGLELGQLRRAMESRGTIDLARGVLMAAFAISPEGAWSALVMTSQNTNTKLHRVAQQVVDSAGGTPLPERVQKHLSAAIARLATADGAAGAVHDGRTPDGGAQR
ncbi:ANTAR domain-containing protein [Streptomyces sp. ERV7]|uniref:ANTAR domain-containing protein n=1 Tax=Streptomyces sp. ERV7 TaxID=1322334 RepID=UPI0026D73C0B|nr:ANTAR domain-containing protein [Streptomyces sp. ERV7]